MWFWLMVNKDWKKISTREGWLVKLTDLLDTAKEWAKKEMKERFKENWIEISEEELE